ncbi:sugar transferase [Candidatus Sumerlaeota bacterium]|nr:sugar transferase [Candidatus Sumerlaeota bacterium]
MSHRRHPIWKTLVVMAADLAAIGAGLLLAYSFRFHSGLVPVRGAHDPSDYLRLFPWAWAIWFLALRLENIYRRRSPILDFNVVRRIVTGSILALLIIFAFMFFSRGFTDSDPFFASDFSRALTPLLFAFVSASLIIERAALHFSLGRLARDRQLGLTRTLILGGGAVARKAYECLERHPEHGMAPVGLVVDASSELSGAATADPPILGTLEELESLLESLRIEEVVLAQPDLDRKAIPSILALCDRHMASFRIIPDTTEMLLSGMSVETLSGIPFLSARETPLQGWNAALKRLIDFVAALGGLLLLSPFLALFAWLVRRSDGGPALYVQARVGIDGRRFKIFKFRTMGVDAESDSGPVFADDNDPRCTPIGAWLRRYRLDELPQLLNVLKGDMSLIGPRPERPYFIQQFRDGIPRYMTRHRVKSGITGWAQINGFSGKHGSIAERLDYDLYYIENWSLWLDLKILFITIARLAGTS